MEYRQQYVKYKCKYVNLKLNVESTLIGGIGGIGEKKRPSPSDSATLYKIGRKKKGNDGNMWIIVKNKNGVKRWKLYRKKQKYKISNELSDGMSDESSDKLPDK